MARLAGKAGAFLIDATVPADPTGVVSWELDWQADTVDVTGMDSAGAKEYVASLSGATGTAKILATGDAQNPVANTELRPGLTCVAYLKHASGDTASYHGNVIVTSLKPQVAVDGAVTFDLAFQFTGAVDYAVP